MKTNILNTPPPLRVSPLVVDGLLIRQSEYYKKFFYTDILWIEASGSYCNFHLKDKSPITVSCRLGIVESQLPEGFLVRVHRGFILNLNAVDTFAGNSLRIGEKWIPIGESYRQNVLACFNILDTTGKNPKPGTMS